MTLDDLLAMAPYLDDDAREAAHLDGRMDGDPDTFAALYEEHGGTYDDVPPGLRVEWCPLCGTRHPPDAHLPGDE